MSEKNKRLLFAFLAILLFIGGIGSIFYLSSSNQTLDELNGQLEAINVPEEVAMADPLEPQAVSDAHDKFDSQLQAFANGEYNKDENAKAENSNRLNFFANVFQNVSSPVRTQNADQNQTKEYFAWFKPTTSVASATSDSTTIILDVVMEYDLSDDVTSVMSDSLPKMLSVELDKETGEIKGGFAYE